MNAKFACGAMPLLLVSVAWSQGQPAAPAANTPGSAAATKPVPANAAPAELRTQIYKGTLLDAACAGNGTQTSTPAATSAPAASGNQAPACNVSANTKQFALRTNSGQVYRFDTVGNERAEQAFKEKKKWSDLASAGKPIHAKVSANLSGDRFVVVSIN